MTAKLKAISHFFWCLKLPPDNALAASALSEASERARERPERSKDLTVLPRATRELWRGVATKVYNLLKSSLSFLPHRLAPR